MIASLQSVPTENESLRSEEIRKETAYGLASDLIERGLQSTFWDLLHALIQIAESELIGKDDDFRVAVDKLYRDADTISSLLAKAFPVSEYGNAASLRRKSCRILADEVCFYRQEQFWTKNGAESLIQAEATISKLYGFFAGAEFLMRQIDQEQPDSRVECRCKAPARTPNPYESIDHD
jgi:hypothetical protein